MGKHLAMKWFGVAPIDNNLDDFENISPNGLWRKLGIFNAEQDADEVLIVDAPTAGRRKSVLCADSESPQSNSKNIANEKCTGFPLPLACLDSA
eukprot:CAMPEP_0113852276 /NCGR_PEP_ID=MMETSP0372-20130328/5362_1 /TAXON_ID=340204 /ORGANISM="Lankesteria abbotti" /LENGTH=93 /DNA_ID=CAMNT_0000823691 /DNA_START=336 /DNA_END=614 /DNA_ORIENTATION=- /assembly_acc=CAM_ASM_000359